MQLPSIGSIPESVRNGMLVIFVVVVLALMSRWLGERKGKRYPDQFVTQIRHLITESARWNAMAEQDTNAAMSLVNATYALAYANTARMLLPDDEIMRVCNIHAAEYIMTLTDTQQRAFQALAQSCPHIQPDGPYAMYTGYLA